MFEKVKKEVSKRVKKIANTELNNANLVKAINMKVVPVAAYAMNICRFNVCELKELNKTIKRELRGKDMLGKQARDEQLYLERKRRKRTEVTEGYVQGDKTACRLLHDQVDQSMD